MINQAGERDEILIKQVAVELKARPRFKSLISVARWQRLATSAARRRASCPFRLANQIKSNGPDLAESHPSSPSAGWLASRPQASGSISGGTRSAPFDLIYLAESQRALRPALAEPQSSRKVSLARASSAPATTTATRPRRAVWTGEARKK